MLLLVTIGLVVIAAVALVIGFVSSTVGWIYLSIACSAIAGAVLYVFSRMSRRRVATAPAAGPSPLTAPTPVTATSPVSPVTPEAPPLETVTILEELPPPVTTIKPDEPVPAAETAASATSGWEQPAPVTPLPAAASDEFDEDEEEEEEEVASPPSLADIAQAIHATSEPAPATSAADFPIDRYDDLRVSEILPQLGRLDSDELMVVRDAEAEGRARGTVLNRIDMLLSGPAPAPAPAPASTPARTPAKTAAATKSPAKKAVATKAVATKAVAKKAAAPAKTTATKAVAKKAAAPAKTPAKKAAAAKTTATATKAVAKKAAATAKTPAKKATKAVKK